MNFSTIGNVVLRYLDKGMFLIGIVLLIVGFYKFVEGINLKEKEIRERGILILFIGIMILAVYFSPAKYYLGF